MPLVTFCIAEASIVGRNSADKLVHAVGLLRSSITNPVLEIEARLMFS